MRKRNKGKYQKALILFIVIINVLFTGSVLYVNLSGMMVSDALIYSWFGFTGGELLACAGIKIAKIKNERSIES